MTNLDEHMEEFLADKAAAEAAKKAKQEAEWEADRKKRQAQEEQIRKNKIARNCKYLERIAEALTDMVRCTGSKRTIIHDKDKGRIIIGSGSMSCDVSSQIHVCEDERIVSHGRYGRYGDKREGKGTFSIRIGDNYKRGDSERFRQLRDGTHNYTGIATMLMNYASRRISAALADAQRHRNTDAVKALREEFKMSEWGGVTASTDKEKEVRIDLGSIYTKTTVMTVDQARAFLKVLQEYGFKLNY